MSVVGLLMLIALFFGGFIVIGGEWFQMWKSTDWNGLEPAFRNTVLAAVALLAVHLPRVVWDRGYPRDADVSMRKKRYDRVYGHNRICSGGWRPGGGAGC